MSLRQPLIQRKRSTISLTEHSSSDARKALTTQSKVVLGEWTPHTSDKQMVKEAEINSIIFPWVPAYRIWWTITAMGAVCTAFLVPFQIAFQKEPGTFNDTTSVFELFLNFVFVADIAVNFNLAFYKNELIVFERNEIFSTYIRGMFWVDLLGVLPFETMILVYLGQLGQNTNSTLIVSLCRLVRFVRIYRLKRLSDMLQYNGRISLIWSTLIRNFAVIMFTTHLAACSMYFLARLKDFGPDTWLGSNVDGLTLSGFDRYSRSLWLSVVTFMTVGYGDFASVNTAEMLTMMFFMLVNIVISSWFIGSVTLLVVKGDEKTGAYRDSLETLHQYSQIHEFDKEFEDSLKSHLILDFNNREIADEQVLKNFPSAVRRKILRKLYRGPLTKNSLMEGVPQQFIDAFLTSCTVEIFSPGERIVEQGSVLSDLFLLVGGIAEITTQDITVSIPEQQTNSVDIHLQQLEAGSFIGEIGFFTESPQLDSVTCLTVCKTLTMSQSSYKLLAQDHPVSVGKILRNLLDLVTCDPPNNINMMQSTSHGDGDVEQGYGSLLTPLESFESLDDDASRVSAEPWLENHRGAIKDLVEMHLSKQLDNQTTRFCFAASRGDTTTISLMCDEGFDPNNADYDNRTALMIASMKGNTDVVKLLLKYKADPNLRDMHGSSALYEAVKGGHEDTMKVLSRYKASLCLEESAAASVLCQSVFDGDILLLKRLVAAGISIDASDYDKRTAAHVAAAEGNIAAIRTLAEFGADLALEDRWGNTVQHEAERSNHSQRLLDLIRDAKPVI